jgi:hypothetical protein
VATCSVSERLPPTGLAFSGDGAFEVWEYTGDEKAIAVSPAGLSKTEELVWHPWRTA